MRAAFASSLACLAASLALAARANAEDLPGLTVHRTDDTLDCPDATALANAVDKQMKRPSLEPDGKRVALDVQIYKSALGYTAVLVAGTKTRPISDPGPTCAGLGEALAVMIAIVLDTELELPPATPAPPPPSPVGPRPPGRATPPYDPWAIDEEAPIVDLPPPPRTWSISASLGAMTTLGVTLPGGYGITGDVQARASKALSFDVGVAYLAPQRVYFAGGTIDISLTASYLRTCLNVLGSPSKLASLGACLEPMVGAMRAQSEGFPSLTSNPSSSKPWFAAFGMAQVEGRFTGPIGYVVHGGAVVPFVRQAFSIQTPTQPRTQNVAFEPSPVGLVLDAQLRVQIW